MVGYGANDEIHEARQLLDNLQDKDAPKKRKREAYEGNARREEARVGAVMHNLGPAAYRHYCLWYDMCILQTRKFRLYNRNYCA
jgi:hypothetical protein